MIFGLKSGNRQGCVCVYYSLCPAAGLLMMLRVNPWKRYILLVFQLLWDVGIRF